MKLVPTEVQANTRWPLGIPRKRIKNLRDIDKWSFLSLCLSTQTSIFSNGYNFFEDFVFFFMVNDMTYLLLAKEEEFT